MSAVIRWVQLVDTTFTQGARRLRELQRVFRNPIEEQGRRLIEADSQLIKRAVSLTAFLKTQEMFKARGDNGVCIGSYIGCAGLLSYTLRSLGVADINRPNHEEEPESLSLTAVLGGAQ